MRKQQLFAIFISIVVVLILYFGVDTMPPKQKELEKSRSLNLEVTGTKNITDKAMSGLDAENKSVIEALLLDADNAKDDSTRVKSLKVLASTWYELGHPAVSAIYAEEIAGIEKTEPSWSVTGTTFMICARSEKDEKTRDFCIKRALNALETAISLDPEKVEPQINRALVYVDNPDQENPMKGILMLRELQEKYPQNTSILNQLASLALKTNQVDKALERLQESYKIDPTNNATSCLLAMAYEMSGDQAKAKEFGKKCKS
jgi:tetratricopeptide (TPR) repeat protein